MSDTPSQFIVPQYETTEGFESASGSASGSGSASAPAPEPKEIHIDEIIKRDDVDVAELEAALESIPVDEKPKGASVVDSVFHFFGNIVELIKYIFQSLSSGIGINEFQFGYIVLGLGALFMTLPLWGEPRLVQNPLPRNARNPTVYTPVNNVKRNTNADILQPQVE